MKKLFRFIGRIVVYIFLIYLLLCTMLYFLPELFLYHPNGKVADIDKARRNGYPAALVNYESKDGTELYGWYSKPEEHNGKLIVFFHGNGFNLEAFYMKVAPFYRYGYATFMPEYRGFGGIKGEINNENLVEDALAAMDEVYKLGYKNEDIIVYGFSLGSHMAINSVYSLKGKGSFEALVLEVPLSTVPNVAKAVFPIYMPFDVLIKDKYDNISLIPDIDTKVLVMAAVHDRIVPYELALDLFDYAKEPKQLIVYNEGGHNNLYDFENFVDVRNWLEKK